MRSHCYQSAVRGQEADGMMLSSLGTLLAVTIKPYNQRFRKAYEHSLARCYSLVTVSNGSYDSSSADPHYFHHDSVI